MATVVVVIIVVVVLVVVSIVRSGVVTVEKWSAAVLIVRHVDLKAVSLYTSGIGTTEGASPLFPVHASQSTLPSPVFQKRATGFVLVVVVVVALVALYRWAPPQSLPSQT